MKAVLKTIKPIYHLNYEETFNGPENIKIRRELVPELIKSLRPTYKPSVQQITRWLSSLHKSRRSQAKLKKTGKISEDYRRVHANNRSNDVCKCDLMAIFSLIIKII